MFIVSILFAGLRLGAQLGLQLSFGIPRELGGAVIALMILFVAAGSFYVDIIERVRKLIIRLRKPKPDSLSGPGRMEVISDGRILSIFNLSLVHSGIRLATPIILAALGGAICNRAGVLNFALEGKMLWVLFWASWAHTIWEIHISDCSLLLWQAPSLEHFLPFFTCVTTLIDHLWQLHSICLYWN